MRLSLSLILLLISLFSISQDDSLNLNAEQKSVHQLELEYYNSLGNSTADFYEAIPNSKKISFEKGGCTLNKIVYGWHPYWNSNTHQNYQWDLISHFSFFSYEVNSADGQPISTHGWATSAAVDAALANNVKVTLCVTLFSGHSTFFGSPTAQQTLITNLINMVQSRGADGVNIDFEGLPASQTANFASFMVNLSNQMHAAIPGSEVSTVLYAVDWNNVFDIATMEPEVDHYIIMGYDYYYSGSSTAGPTDPLYQFGTTYNYTLSRSITYYLDKGIPANKLVLGLPYYGWDYATTASTIPSNTSAAGSSRTYTTVRTNASGNYVAGNQLWQYDAISDTYVYNSGGNRQCFIALDSAFNKRLEHVLHSGIAGIGIWALGYDNGYTDRWNSLRDYLTDCYTAPCSATIHDFGGPVKSYYNNEDYTWTIAPQGAVSLDVNFSSFDVELDWDYLYIYDGPNTSSPQIPGSPFTGTTSPGSFTSSTGAITFRFTSDVSTVASGFLATYTCNTLPPPAASFSNSTPLSICLGDSILIQSTSTNAATYQWTVNEGVLSNPTTSETYLSPSTSGTYDVTLTVTNATGTDQSTQSYQVIVGSPLNTNITLNSTDLTLPGATALFTNSTSNAEGFSWDFGDGNTSTDVSPWNTYQSEGVYTVTCIVYNSLCGNDTLTWDIVVHPNTAELNDQIPDLLGVYPNPAMDFLTIQFENETTFYAAILDANSRVVKEKDIVLATFHQLDISELSLGTYILLIRTESGTSHIRFIKQ